MGMYTYIFACATICISYCAHCLRTDKLEPAVDDRLFQFSNIWLVEKNQATLILLMIQLRDNACKTTVWRHVCCELLRDATDKSARPRGKHVRTKTTDMIAVLHADISAVSRNRRDCCVTRRRNYKVIQHTCVLRDAAGKNLKVTQQINSISVPMARPKFSPAEMDMI